MNEIIFWFSIVQIFLTGFYFGMRYMENNKNEE